MFQVHFRTLFEGEKNSFADLNREISEAEAILSDQADQIDDRRNFSLFGRHSYFDLRVGVGFSKGKHFFTLKKVFTLYGLKTFKGVPVG